MSKKVTIRYTQKMECSETVELTDAEYNYLTKESDWSIQERSKYKHEKSIFNKLMGAFNHHTIIDSHKELDVEEVKDAE
jgi:hypothetical protein